jgi:putative endonuclease
MKQFFVYILTNTYNTCFYVGVTSNISQRYFEHKLKLHPTSFTSRYNLHKVVFLAPFSDPIDAITYEKKLKGWNRKRKIALICASNPSMSDLAK